MSYVIRIDNFSELNALMRLVVEGKFSENPRDLDVSWSPIVAKIVREIALVMESASPPELSGESASIQFQGFITDISSTRPEWLVALQRVRDAGANWTESSASEKMKSATILLAPYRMSESRLRDFIREADEIGQSEQ